MPGRKFSAAGQYRYGFNGKEKSDEVYGDGNVYDYGFRIYNPRLGKFLSVDPLTYSYPYYTPYQFAGNMPIAAIDLDGLEQYVVIYYKHQKGGDPYKVEIRAIQAGKVMVDQNVQRRTKEGQRDGQRIATNNVLVFEAYNEGTKNEQMKVIDQRSSLTKDEKEIYSHKKGDKSGNAGFLYTSEDNPKYESDDIEDGIYYVAEKMMSQKVQPSIKIIKDVPAFIISEGADNGDIIQLGDFSKNLKNSLASVKKGSNVKEIKIDINIVALSEDGRPSILAVYTQKAKGKIEQQVNKSVQNITGVDKNKIKVNLTVTSGRVSDSKTTVQIK